MTQYFTSIVNLYANAFFDFALANGELDKLSSQAQKLQQLIAQDKALIEMIAAPIYSDIEQQQLLQKISDQLELSHHISNLLNILAKNKRLHLLEPILKSFNVILTEHNGYKIVEVCLAQKLSEKEQNNVKLEIEKMLSSKVKLTFELDPEILGGIVIKVDDKMIDASLAGRFVYLKEAISNKISQLELN